MNARTFFLHHLLEIPFCLTGAVCSCVCLLEGFFIPEEYLGRVLPVIFPCLLTLILLTAASWSRLTSVIGIAAGALASAVFVIQMLSGEDGIVSHGLFYLLCILTTAALYLLTRTPAGGALAFALNSLIICGNVFMQYGRHPVLLIAGVISVGVLFLIRQYQASVLKYSTRRIRMRGIAVSAMALCLSAAVLSGALCAALTPLQLPTVRVKLVTELSSLSVLEKIGVSRTVHLMDPMQTVWGRNSETMVTNGEGQSDKGNPQPDPDQGQSESTDQKPQSGGQQQTGSTAPANAISYEYRSLLKWMIPLLVLLVAAALFSGKILLRKRRTDRLIRQLRREQIPQMYQYILKMSGLMKLPAAASETPLEYSERIGGRMDACVGGRGQMRRLTEIFAKVCYGGAEPDTEEYRMFVSVYRNFPRRLRQRVGTVKYILQFFFRT